jgi:hypothetical protein
MIRTIRIAGLATACTALFAPQVFAQAAVAAKPVMNTQCTAIQFCYCVDDAFLPLIDARVKSLRAMIATERAKGKAIGYLSVPLSTRAGGYFNLNSEISAAAKGRIEERLGRDHAWVLNPAMKDADLAAVMANTCSCGRAYSKVARAWATISILFTSRALRISVPFSGSPAQMIWA